LPAAAKLPEGLDQIAHDVRGLWHRRATLGRGLARLSQQCAATCESLKDLSEEELSARLTQARELLRRDPLHARGRLLEALAAVGEVAARVKGMRPYPVQFMAALALQRGLLAEMATGEGKTLTVALAAVLAAWSSRPCHVITSNDYLACRDAQEMAPLYARCGLSVAGIDAAVESARRPALYASDVVYVTAKELLADHLRDELAARAGRDPRRLAFENWLEGSGAPLPPPVLLVRGLHGAIVDEADNVLVDEAVTPLILSAPRNSHDLGDAARSMAVLAARLKPDEDYEVLPQRRTVTLRAGARLALDQLAPALPTAWRAEPRREELLRQALTVRHFILMNHQYVVDEGKIVLLDEFTGRLTPGRTLMAGLHQAVEAKEGVEITDPNESLGQLSFQTFFRRFPRLAGTSGTAREAAAEFWRIYGLAVLPIPTHRPRLTVTAGTRVFATAQARWKAVTDHVASLHQAGQPVLIGVRSVDASLVLARELEARGLPFALLNAVLHEQEAGIVAQAGGVGRITIATNMAGRGTDIRLGPEVLALGGLHVVIAEANESARVSRQLAGRCGRQGDPGSVAVMLSLDDGLVHRFVPVAMRRILSVLAGSSAPWRERFLAGALRLAQRRAEAEAYARRRAVLKADDWLDKALPFEGA
jgi:preprotein translocase subunit SecA